jgi:isopentenyl diphosphate isomerase/L-lactate dehydrogenase-like FMN-dependent dehydrogenase
MSWPAIRSGSDVLRALVIGAGFCWSIAFVANALTYRLQL